MLGLSCEIRDLITSCIDFEELAKTYSMIISEADKWLYIKTKELEKDNKK